MKRAGSELKVLLLNFRYFIVNERRYNLCLRVAIIERLYKKRNPDLNLAIFEF
jgi:hypothetical protein